MLTQSDVPAVDTESTCRNLVSPQPVWETAVKEQKKEDAIKATNQTRHKKRSTENLNEQCKKISHQCILHFLRAITKGELKCPSAL